MRHKYDTEAIVLSRSPLGEANALVTLITPHLGVVRARAQGLRKPGAKLSAALVTFSHSNVVLVRGKEGWRITGAIQKINWFEQLSRPEARARASRVNGLLLRLIAGEAHDREMFSIIQAFFEAVGQLSETEQEAAEMLVVLRILAALGLDAGEIPGKLTSFDSEWLRAVEENHMTYVARINQGIAASGL